MSFNFIDVLHFWIPLVSSHGEEKLALNVVNVMAARRQYYLAKRLGKYALYLAKWLVPTREQVCYNQGV